MKFPEILKRGYVQTIIMIVVVILAVLLFWYGLRFAFRTEYPILAVASGSMEPILYKGDLIVVEGIENVSDIYVAPKDTEKPGDIVVYQGATELIVHRAIDKKIGTDGKIVFIIHGDANAEGANEHVHESKIIGRYVGFKVPWLGQIALAFQKTETKVAFIALWILVLIGIEAAPYLIKKLKGSNDGEPSLYK
ncbi:MAG: signal peptidase I [Candidatus Bathyarchaeota archaeon]|nr:signal peptidase I [Candidatus Bathyarchaeum sp.]